MCAICIGYSYKLASRWPDAIALSLGELSTGVLLAAAIVAGDPCGGTMFYDVLDDAGRLEELKKYVTPGITSKEHRIPI